MIHRDHQHKLLLNTETPATNNTNKCNQFIGDKIEKSGGTVPRLSGEFPMENQWSGTIMNNLLNIVVMTIIVSSFSQLKAEGNMEILERMTEHILENRLSPSNHPEIIANFPGILPFTREVSSLAPKSISEIITQTDNIEVQAVILYASEDLPPRKYLDLVELVVTLSKSGNLPPEVMSLALFPRGKKKLIIVDNYTDKQVVRILNNAKVVYGEGSNLSRSMDTVLSGESKAYFDKQREHVIVEARPKPPIRLDEDRNDSP